MPVEGSRRTTSWLASASGSRSLEAEARRLLEHEPQLGLRDGQELAGANEERHPGPPPVVDVEPKRGVGLGRRVGGDAVDVAVAVVLAAYVVRGVGFRRRAEHRGLRVLDRGGITAGRCLHRRGRHDLHEVVDHDVAQRADGVVEVTAIRDPEVLRHRDLHGLDVVPVPHRFEHRVREAEVEDLLEPHLAEVVVDAEELRLVDVLVQLVGKRVGRVEVVAERLLHHDRAVFVRPASDETLHNRAEEERRDLQVEHRSLARP